MSKVVEVNKDKSSETNTEKRVNRRIRKDKDKYTNKDKYTQSENTLEIDSPNLFFKFDIFNIYIIHIYIFTCIFRMMIIIFELLG
jgi:hypothetical protein